MASSEASEVSRVDKWLHGVRVFKTRSLATLACQKGQVTLSGQTVKPGRDLRVGEVLEVVRGELRLRLKVIGHPPQRVGAPRVAEFCENLTPAEWYEKAAAAREQRRLETPNPQETLLKPNKKQLRQLRAFWEQESETGA